MSEWLIYCIGFFAQILFSGRMLVQWISSEKHKKVVAPTLFWMLSLLASLLMFVYGFLRTDFAIMFGQSLTYFIYIRNLQLQKQWLKFHPVLRIGLIIGPIIAVFYYFNSNIIDLTVLLDDELIPRWLLWLGIISQLVFTFRFIYQWLYSERQKTSTLPLGFWLLSLIGSALILTYAIFRKDPVLLVSHLLGSVIYIRNLMILIKEEK